jgi:pilus assembly protein CpaF
MEGNTITTQEIFSFQQRGIDPAGKVKGRFAFGGIRPKFIDRFRMAGITVSPGLFDPTNTAEV